MSKFKMKFEQKENSNPSLYIYGEVAKTFEDLLNGAEGNTANGVKSFLDAHQDADAIDVYINSLGGDVVEGTAMANQLRRFKGDVNVVVDGFAASVASVIASAGTHVAMPKNATMMLHNMWTYTVGNAQELRKTADDLDVLMEANKTIYLDKAGDKLTYDKLTQMLDEETWLTAQQCVDYGLCDEVMDYDVDRSQMAQEAGVTQAQERTDDSIERLKQSRELLMQLSDIAPDQEQEVEVESLEIKEEQPKPTNFLSIFS